MHTTSLCHSLRLVARSLVRPPPPFSSSLRATKRTVTRNALTGVCFASGSTVRYLRAWPRWTELWAKSSHSRVLPLLSTAYVTDPTTQPPHTLGPNREPTLAPRRTLFVAIRQRRVALWLAFAGSTLTLRHLSPRDSSNAAVLLPVAYWNCEWLWCSLTRRRHTPAGVGFFHAVRATVFAIVSYVVPIFLVAFSFRRNVLVLRYGWVWKIFGSFSELSLCLTVFLTGVVPCDCTL